MTQWLEVSGVEGLNYTCGHCGSTIASEVGWVNPRPDERWVVGRRTIKLWDYIRICHMCDRPTFFSALGEQMPAPLPGDTIGRLPSDVAAVYDEARKAFQAGAFTACVLTCRKLIMHVAVEKGAADGSNFKLCVDHLETKNFIPPNAKPLVDHIRTRGNEANHEIVLMAPDDAELLVEVSAMVLRYVYEVSARATDLLAKKAKPTPP